MLRIINVFALILIFSSCYTQHTKESVIFQKYELFFYPGRTPQSVRYSIVVNGDSIQAKNHRSVKNNKKTHYTGKLSIKQLSELSSLYSRIIIEYPKRSSSVTDTWGVSLIVDNKKIYEDDDFSLEGTPEEIRKLIEYLIKIGVIKIELLGFA